jgi:hypothetical protein
MENLPFDGIRSLSASKKSGLSRSETQKAYLHKNGKTVVPGTTLLFVRVL